MEQMKMGNISPGPCEKFFKAFNIIPAFKAMRRISDRPQSPIPTTAAASPVPGADHAAKARPETKLAAQQQPNSVVPITIESPVVHPTPPNGKEKLNGKMAEQGKKAAGQKPKPEAKTPHISYQVKPVKNMETVSPAKPLVEQGKQRVDSRDNSREQDNKTVPHSGDRFTDFINRTMFKFRAPSDVGKSSTGHDGAQIKKRTSSNVVGGKSISFKK